MHNKNAKILKDKMGTGENILLDENKRLWNSCLQIFKEVIANDNQYNTWFAPLNPLSWNREEHTLKLQVPSSFFKEYLEANYANLLKKTLVRVYGNGVQLKYVEKLDNDIVIEEKKKKIVDNNKSQQDSHLNSNYTFDNFIEGECNKLARTAGESIASNPGKTFNPLLLWGDSGLGKTHLENAIGEKILENFPKSRVIYVDARDIVTQFTDAVLHNNSNDFIKFYQTLDVLIVDDIQELTGKTGTQNAFFHIFNTLHQAGKQLIFASDRSPKMLQGLDQRLLSRFKWGLSVEMNKPDYLTRLNILKDKIEGNNLDIPTDVMEYIAKNVTGNIRDLEGIINSLLAHATLLNNANITLDLAKTVVGQNIDIEEKKIGIVQIEEIVCDYYNLELNEIQTTSRKREVVQARQIAMYLSRKLTNKSLACIGAEIGKRNHATVLHACKTVEGLIDIDKSYRKSVESIENMLR